MNFCSWQNTSLSIFMVVQRFQWVIVISENNDNVNIEWEKKRFLAEKMFFTIRDRFIVFGYFSKFSFVWCRRKMVELIEWKKNSVTVTHMSYSTICCRYFLNWGNPALIKCHPKTKPWYWQRLRKRITIEDINLFISYIVNFINI